MKDRIVLFTQRVEIVESFCERRDCADQRIADFISACGFLPVPLANNKEVAAPIVYELAPVGIVLTGGNSLMKYGGNAPERDEVDRELIRIALDKHIPLYGFCRGMQSILDYFGNELVNVKGHVAIRHKITGLQHSIEVNSYHNQGCICLKSNDLKAIMKTDDQVIEKIRHKKLPIIGTMWHPERENPFHEMDINMVRNLISAN